MENKLLSKREVFEKSGRLVKLLGIFIFAFAGNIILSPNLTHDSALRLSGTVFMMTGLLLGVLGDSIFNQRRGRSPREPMQASAWVRSPLVWRSLATAMAIIGGGSLLC
ncbi:hypothetical protein GZ176_11695 [Dermatophilus congolensis]|uniref:hypothetical protein n=1 Tax=Dermatophilus congolensis TaxID=1863 RepID=UPI001AAE79D4|nr:hypothetical protein [Dermatophilus congolensis]MBO3146346.1 hypothetical protein [Dermatophilus congolensis]MBO3148611.1 hypothetical protein [Dermatophilus congolensis]MBO3157583.1 hypothetical protein [Dermatophilus congolensis]MBO3159863.1 hypothetical protein [Dermatophilus congolensis]MBO3166602.1 hypothetical protein [Dermatophilus congolensis]